MDGIAQEPFIQFIYICFRWFFFGFSKWDRAKMEEKMIVVIQKENKMLIVNTYYLQLNGIMMAALDGRRLTN